LMQERNALREALKEKEMSLLEYKDRDQVLKATITSASIATDKMKNDAEREAKLILNDAQHKAEVITRDAKDSLRKTYQEIADLKKMRMQFEANLKAMVQAHMSLLEQSDHFMPKMRIPDLDF
jgi:cell division initiation protein